MFGKLLFRLAVESCRRYHLQEQDRDEVVQETYSQVLDPTIVRFDPHRGNATSYLRGQVQNAAQKVAAALTRHRTQDDPRLANTIPEPRSTPLSSELERRETAAFVMQLAPTALRQALQLLHWEGWSMQSVARHLRASRFTLARKINHFYQQMRIQLDPASAIN